MNARRSSRWSGRRRVALLAVRAVLAVVLIGVGLVAPAWSVWAAILVDGSAADMLAWGLVVGMLAVFMAMVVAP